MNNALFKHSMLWNSTLRATVATTRDKALAVRNIYHKVRVFISPVFKMLAASMSPPSPASTLSLPQPVAMTPTERWGLSSVSCTDQNDKIILINSPEAIKYESENVEGFVLLRLKDDSNTAISWTDRPTFEIQFQGKIKNGSPPNLMLGCELSEPLQLGFFSNILLTVLTTLGTTLYPFVHIGLGEKVSSNGSHEVPHIMFPLFQIVDSFVVTMPGEQPPALGGKLFESEEAKTARKASNNCELRPDCVYTFSFDSKFLDFALWNVCNIPGGSKSFTDFFGKQPIKIVAYDLDSSKGTNAPVKGLKPNVHHNSMKKYLLNIKMTHVSVMVPDQFSPTPKL